MVIKALNKLKSQTEKQIVHLHVGDGPLNTIEQDLALKEGVQDNVVFLETLQKCANY